MLKSYISPYFFVTMVKTKELTEDITRAIISKCKTFKWYKAISKDLGFSCFNSVQCY